MHPTVTDRPQNTRAIADVDYLFVQFRVANKAAVPKLLIKLENEDPEERAERTAKVNGTMIVPSTQHTGLEHLPEQLEQQGFVMVAAWYQSRWDTRGTREQHYYLVHFAFARNNFATPSRRVRLNEMGLRLEFQRICKTTMWACQVYRNPLFTEGGEIVPGKFAISVNLAAREPLFDDEEQPVLRWQKDAGGAKIGDSPLPLAASHQLRIEKDELIV